MPQKSKTALAVTDIDIGKNALAATRLGRPIEQAERLSQILDWISLTKNRQNAHV
jgi:hypothetical protein